MKNKLLVIILFILLLPTIVLAKDTCNDNDIKIKAITLKELNGFSEEVEESTINNNTINLNLKMYDVGDSSTYDITIENTSNEDYYFTKDSMKLENDYLEYSLKNDSEIIHAKEEKTIELKVSYKNQIPNENYSDTSKLIISLSDKPLNNPKTNTNHYILLIILITLIPIYIKNHKKGLLLLSIFGIVSNVYATCTVNLNVEAKIEIENKEAIFLPGGEVNIKMKQLAGDDTSTVTNGYTFQDENITAVKYSDSEPIESNKQEKNIVSTSDSPYPIYMWYEDNTIYWWSEDIHPSLNENASYMFYSIRSLNDITGVKNYDVSITKDIQFMFAGDKLSNTNALTKWNVSNVTNMQGLYVMNPLESLEGLKNWNTSNVTNMMGTFLYNSYLPNLNGLENWDTSNVEDMSSIFQKNKKLTNMDAIKNWDVSKVKKMDDMFSSCINLEEINLSNWRTNSLTSAHQMFAMWSDQGTSTDEGKLKRIILSEKFNTSKVTTMRSFIANNDELEDYSFLQYLDTSNVTNMNSFFQLNLNFNNLNYLQNWDVSKVTDFQWMFFGDNKITDASFINNWNISSSANFARMFRGVPTHPEFTKVQGTWSSGTFTPTP